MILLFVLTFFNIYDILEIEAESALLPEDLIESCRSIVKSSASFLFGMWKFTHLFGIIPLGKF